MRTSRTGRYLSDLAQNQSIRTASKLDNDKVEENAGSGPTAIVSRLMVKDQDGSHCFQRYITINEHKTLLACKIRS